MFDAAGEADGRAFAERCSDDRHHFRFMVSPEDAAQMADLRATTRDLMRQAERDLGTRLDWVAVDHWNTEHPHVHILVRGVAEDGSDLVISRDYISHGFRARAQALVSLELGPRSPREIAAGLQRQAEAERWTPLDRLLQTLAEDRAARIDLRPGSGAAEPDVRLLLLGRMKTLERLGLAISEGPGCWRLSPEHETILRALGTRGDIIKTLHRAMGEARALSELDPDGAQAPEPILGRLMARGLHDETSGEAFVVIDGIDGRAHHVRVPDLEAAGDTPVGGLVEAAPGLGRGGVRILHRSDLDLDAQVGADGATWLDRKLVAREQLPLAERGFGADVRRALSARADWLADRGLAGRVGGLWSPARDLLRTLCARELGAAAAAIEAEGRLRFVETAEGETVSGRYARRLSLASGRFAMIEDGLGFRLVPWTRRLEPERGQEVTGTLTAGGVDWRFARSRDLSR
jgi:type IV secretory pathway VirD2 relaxase